MEPLARRGPPPQSTGSASDARPRALGHDMLDMDRKVARCRMLLSLVALASVWADPTTSVLVPIKGLHAPPLGIDARLLTVLLVHLSYSAAVYLLLLGPRVSSPRMLHLTTWNDVLFSGVIALFTAGVSSPFYVFFTFAVVAAAVRSGFRYSMVVTAVAIWVYLSLVVVSGLRGTQASVYMMRPFYLAVVGYLVSYLGRQRLVLETRLRALERTRERNEIARALHDGCVQVLAGSNLALESAQELVRRGQAGDAIAALRELQTSVTREYDSLRTYVRELADRGAEPPETPRGFETRFALTADFVGSGAFVEHVLHILLEGVRNVRRHAFARSATIGARAVEGEVRISIDDDGVGLPQGATAPWSIASRVDQLGGHIRLAHTDSGGAHVAVVLPGA